MMSVDARQPCTLVEVITAPTMKFGMMYAERQRDTHGAESSSLQREQEQEGLQAWEDCCTVVRLDDPKRKEQDTVATSRRERMQPETEATKKGRIERD